MTLFTEKKYSHFVITTDNVCMCITVSEALPQFHSQKKSRAPDRPAQTHNTAEGTENGHSIHSDITAEGTENGHSIHSDIHRNVPDGPRERGDHGTVSTLKDGIYRMYVVGGDSAS